MSTYWSESFYRATIRQSIDSTQTVPFTLKVSKIPTLTTGLLTVSPNTANEEILEYNGVDGTALTITVVKRGISPSTQALTVDGTDYNNTSYQNPHSQNDSIRADVNHLHIIQDYGNLQAQINTKVNTAWGVRTGLTANAIMRTNGSWVESADAIGSITPISSDTVLMQRGWDIVESPYSSIITDVGDAVGNIQEIIAGEALTKDDFVSLEIQRAFAFSANTWVATSNTVGNTSASTKTSVAIIGNGISMSSLNLSLAKVGAPADSITIRIETDTAGKPSWTLADINATASISWASLTTTLADTTVTFWGVFILTSGVSYHIVAQRITSVDAANYYIIGWYTKNVRWFLTNTHNGTVWWTAGWTTMIYIASVWIYSSLAVKTNATHTDNINFIWMVTSNVAKWVLANIFSSWIQKWITSTLTPHVYYYLSNTPWLISTTPWTNSVIVWISISGSSLKIITIPKISWVINTSSGSSSGTSSIIEWIWTMMYINMSVWNTAADWTATFQSSYDGITFNTITSITTAAPVVSTAFTCLWIWYFRFVLSNTIKSYSITY